MLQTLWRRQPAWDSCHFFGVLETLIKRKDEKLVQRFIKPKDQHVTHFVDPAVLQ